MIEFYLKQRERLINILEMIDGKERPDREYLSKNRAPKRRWNRALAQTVEKRAINLWFGGF